MSWNELFAADDVSTRKVERVFDVNLGRGRLRRGERSCKTQLCRDHHSRHVHTMNVLGEKCRQIRLFTSVVQKRFGFQETAWKILAERVEN